MRKLVKDISIYGSGDFIFKLIAFALFPIYTRLLSVEDFGLMTLLNTSLMLLGMFSNVGLNNAINRFYYDTKHIAASDRPLLVSTGLTILIGTSILLSLLAIVVLYPFSFFLQSQYNITYILAILVILANTPTQILQYSLDTIRLQFKPLHFTLLSFFKNLFGSLIAIALLWYTNLGLSAYFLGIAIGLIVTLPLGLWYIRKNLIFKFSKSFAKQLTLFGYPFIFTGIAYWLLSSIDRWMLLNLSTQYELGLYSISFKVNQIILFVVAAFGQAWSPYAIKLYDEDPNYRTLIGKVLTYLFLTLVIIAFLMGLYSQELLIITTPKEYWAASSFIVVIAIGICFQGTTQITAYGITIEKKPHLMTIGSWLTAFINIALNYLLIPTIGGALGAACATALSFLFMTLFYLYHTQKLHSFNLEIRKLIIILIFALILTPVCVYMNSLDWSINNFLIKIIISVIAITLLTVIKIIDLAIIKKIFKKKFS